MLKLQKALEKNSDSNDSDSLDVWDINKNKWILFYIYNFDKIFIDIIY